MLYTFTCKNGHEKEYEFSMKDKPRYIKCEECGEQAETLIKAAPRFILKGNGWFRDEKKR